MDPEMGKRDVDEIIEWYAYDDINHAIAYKFT